MLRALLALACLALGFAAPADAQYVEGGARLIGMGRTGVAIGGEPWGQANPATWATADRSAGVEASQAYGLSDLRLGGASGVVPLSFGTVALGARVYGTEGYSETRLIVGASRDLKISTTRRLAVGVSAGYDGVSIDGFGSTGSVHLDVGVQGDMVPSIRAGLAFRNLVGLVDDTDTDLTRPLGAVPSVAAGVAYTPSDRALLALDLDQRLDGNLSVRAGLEARVVDALALRLGLGTAPVRFSGGIGIQAGPLAADIAVEHHETLGLTPAVSLQVGF